jgi:chromosome partitioning protein
MITVIANLKGGTGKSTVTFNLAVWLGSMNRRATVIDLDPQRTLSDVAALRLEEGVEPAIHVEAGAFADVAFPEDAEEIIIDVGTADLESFKQAIMVADRILIPVTPSQADVWSTQRFIRFLSKNTHGNPPESLTFLNRVDTRKANQAPEQAAAALNTLPVVRLLSQRLSDRPVFRDSLSESLAVFELQPHSIASRELKALAEVLFPDNQHAVVDRLRQQKTSTATAPGFRQMLETPSDKMSVRQGGAEVNIEADTATAAGQQSRQTPQADKVEKPGKGKHRKSKQGDSKKPKKAAKAKSGNKAKKNKKRKKNKKAKKNKS